MHALRRLFLPFILLAGCLATQDARAGRSYDNCTGFIDSIPATISTQGVWCLRQHLSTAITSGNAITITANNVTIDCNDFRIGGLAAGNGSLAKGILAQGRQNTVIRNCGIRGFHRGIELNAGAGHLVEDNRLDNNLGYGIYVSGGGLVQRNRVYDTGGTSSQGATFAIAAGANLVDNEIRGVFSTVTDGSVCAICAAYDGGGGAAIRDNRINQLVPNGAGSAYGITGFGTANGGIAARNIVSSGSTAVNGIGVNSLAACLDNVVSGFTIPYSSCPQAGTPPP